MNHSVAEPALQKVTQTRDYTTLFMVLLLPPIGIILLYLSFYFEAQAYQSIFGEGDSLLGLGGYQVKFSALVSFALNAVKVIMSFLVAYNVIHGLSNRATASDRVGLLGLSIFGTMLVLAQSMVSPNADTLYQQSINVSSQQFKKLKRDQQNDYAEQNDRIAEFFKQESQSVRDINQKEIDAARSGFSAEELVRDASGNFYGPRAREYEDLINKAKDRMLSDLRTLRIDFNADSQVLSSKHKDRMLKLNAQASEAVKAIRLNDFINTSESENKDILALVTLINNVAFGGANVVSSNHITFFFILVLTLVIEFSPMLIFGSLFRRLLTRKERHMITVRETCAV